MSVFWIVTIRRLNFLRRSFIQYSVWRQAQSLLQNDSST